MFNKFLSILRQKYPAPVAHAHCDGPCGVYDPASARIAAEATLSMTKKMLALEPPKTDKSKDMASYHNTMARFAKIKEEQAELAKHELLVLWTDYFKPEHLEEHKNLHDLFWKTAKLCSACKQEVSLEHAEDLMKNVEEIHNLFWKTKGKSVPWMTAS